MHRGIGGAGRPSRRAQSFIPSAHRMIESDTSMTTVSPHGLQILQARANRRDCRSRGSAHVAARGVSLELLVSMAVIAALVGAVFPI